MKTSEQRKSESIKILNELNIPVYEGLPVIENAEETTLRTKEEIVKRAIAVCTVAIYAESLLTGEHNSKEIIDKFIEKYNAKTFFTKKERNFINSKKLTEMEVIQFSWQYEAYNVLLWALNLVDELNIPNEICDVKKIVSILNDCSTYEEFEKKSNVRKIEQILDQADLIYRYDWAVVDARISNKTLKGINSGVVYERHRALNWLINYMEQDWDSVITDT